MSFAERVAPSSVFEQEIVGRLTAYGWMASLFGQAQLPREFRHRLARFEDSARRPSLIRWMPDILTGFDRNDGRSYVALIDAKVCTGPRYAVEMSAIDAAEIWTNHMFTPTFFVFDDWGVLTPLEIRQRGFPGPFRGNGSGTPFVLIERQFARPFDYFFPRRGGAHRADRREERDGL